LKRSNWQYHSDQVLTNAGFYPARLDVHQPCPPGLHSLSTRRPLHFIPSLPPWGTPGSYHIHVTPTLPGASKKFPPEQQLEATEAKLTRKRKNFTFDYSFWTDGSVSENGNGTAACLTFATDENPAKQRKQGDLNTTVAACPVGYADASCKAEKVALELPPALVNDEPQKYEHTNLFIGSDSQSGLMALAAGPL